MPLGETRKARVAPGLRAPTGGGRYFGAITPDPYNLQPGDMFAGDEDKIVIINPAKLDTYFKDAPPSVIGRHNGQPFGMPLSDFIAMLGSIDGIKPAGRVALAENEQVDTAADGSA